MLGQFEVRAEEFGSRMKFVLVTGRRGERPRERGLQPSDRSKMHVVFDQN